MRLNVDLTALWAAVRAMGAEEIPFRLGIEQAPLSPLDVALDAGGIEVEFKDIDFNTGLASYQGRQILLYIPDHRERVASVLADGARGNKFHVANCEKLDEMRKAGRFERYVVTTKLDGRFRVSGNAWPSTETLTGEAELKVCKLCLTYLNYQGYSQARSKVFESFDIAEFFETYSSYFKHIPASFSVAETEYSPQWQDISKTIRQQDDYQCQHCKVRLNTEKHLLHVHHKNGVRSDNRRENLLSLCADCHRKQPDHQRMFVSHTDTRRINQLRNEQGIKVADWPNIYALADPALRGVISLLQQHALPLPEVGLVIGDKPLKIQIELAWLHQKVGVAINEQDAMSAKSLGWRIYSMRNVLQKPEILFNKIR